MIIPPVLVRELRVRATRRRTFWVRTAMAGTALGTWLATVLLGGIPVRDGRAALALLGAIPWLLATFGSLITTADCLSREKRERTLPLLLLTELRPFEIVGQKLVAGSANLFLILLALAPVCGLSVLLGGVTIWQVLGFILLLWPVAFFSSCIGCFVSALSRRALPAALGTFILIVGSCTASFLAEQAWPGGFLPLLLGSANPAALYWNVIGGGIAALDVLQGICSMLIGGMVFLGAASFALPKLLSAESRVPVWRISWVTYGGTGVLVLGMLLASFFPPTGVWFPFTILFVNTALKLMVAVEAVRVFNQKEWLEVVLTTPMEVRTYVLEQFKRLARHMAPAFALTLGGNILLASQAWGDDFDFAILALLLLVSDCVALAWAGLASGLTFSRLNEALGWSVARVLLLPLAIFFCGILAGVRTVTFSSALLLYGVLAIGLGALNATASAWLLRHRLRALAAPA